jgi:hypothetical protein
MIPVPAALEGRRFLVLAPSFQPWNSGTYLLRLLRTARLHGTGFPYRDYRCRAAAGEALLEKVRDERPDVVFGLGLEGIEPEILAELRRRGTRLVHWYVDCYRTSVPAWLPPRLEHVDLFLTTAKGMVPLYRAATPTPVEWLLQGVYLPAYPALTLSPEARRVYGSDVAFAGSVLHPPVRDRRLAGHRRRLLARLSRRHSVTVWGPQRRPGGPRALGIPRCRVVRWPAYHEELVRVCRAAGVVLGINTVNSVELYFSNRTFLTLAAGGFHLTHYVPGLETLFENHRHLVWFESDDECLDLCRHYLARPAARRRIAAAGRMWVRRRFGMARQFARLLELTARHAAPERPRVVGERRRR